ncbi:MAG: outer membrane protein assembly factor BamD [Proteobacteria bacterium]|nr:outer membrane protein assembly factor BamD [Pseudomonadota bacterium]
MADLNNIVRWLIVLLLAATLSGCGGSPQEVDPNLGAIKLYEKARQSMITGNFSNAIMRFERLEGRFPFSNQTKQAQLDIIFCYYMNREPDAAVDAADQFILENPTHPRVDYANYIKGMVFFPKKTNKFFRLFKVDPTERPPSSARTSFENFHYLVTNFPDSPYTANARQRMIYLRNYLAKYELHVANYYMDRGAYVAALKRAQNVMVEYQGTTSVADALGVMIDAYEKLDLHEMAQQTRQVLQLNSGRLSGAMSSTTSPD